MGRLWLRDKLYFSHAENPSIKGAMPHRAAYMWAMEETFCQKVGNLLYDYWLEDS